VTATLVPDTRPELVEFRKQDAAIAKLREQYMPLKINGMDDKEGFAKVHDARMIVKNTRVSVEKKRVELKADALAYGRAVDAEAKRLTELLSPIESHLEAEEDCIVQERERIKKEAERKRQAIIQNRVDQFMACGVVPNITDVAALTDEQFAESLAAAQKAKEEREAAAEAQRKAEAEAAEKRRQEEAALAEERAELAKIKAEQEAEAARLAAERRKIEEAEAAKRRAEELEQARKEAAERARVETEQRLAREAAEAKAEAEAEEAARIKAEQERPQREKIAAIAFQVESIHVPDGPGQSDVRSVLVKAAADIRTIAKRRNLNKAI
jgi:colicin import membrane protein